MRFSGGVGHILTLIIPLSAMRNAERYGRSKSLVVNAGFPNRFDEGECEEQRQRVRQLVRDLGHPGPFDGDYCDWPGITCAYRPYTCGVSKLVCETCNGSLPERITVLGLKEVTLTSSKLRGDIRAFQGTPDLQLLDLRGTQVSGDLQVFRETKHLDYLDLANTKIFGNIESLSSLYFPSVLDLSGTNVSGDLKAMSGRRWTWLQVLKVSRTKISGDFATLAGFTRLRVVDLSYTNFYGRMNRGWGRNGDLEILRLQNSSVQFLPSQEDALSLLTDMQKRRVWLMPKLRELNLMNCPVNGPLDHLLILLAMSKVTSIKASAAGIYGKMPKLKGYGYLPSTLLMLDLSRNNVSELHELPVRPSLGRVLLPENHQLVLAPQVLTQAVREHIILDLSGTKLSNEEVVEQLLEEGAVKTTDMYAYRNDVEGYACKDLVGTVKVTPNLFLPQKLCKCLAGWHGSGATCKMCPANTFSEEMGLDTCKSCPLNSTAPAGSTKLAHCNCDFGNIHDGACACDQHHALQGGDCVLCSKMHLQCSHAGSFASTAVPDVGHARLEANAEEARRCLPPDVSQRCPGTPGQCGIGYTGTLCATCEDGYWAIAGRCRPCVTTRLITVGVLALSGVAVLLLAAFLGYQYMYRRGGQEPAASVKSQLKRLLVLQAPGLLQTVQLWIVLSRLGKLSKSNRSLPEIPYLEILQLTIEDLQNSLSLQCTFDAATVRMMAALCSPLLPVFLLACCAALELCRAGFGVNIVLKIIPFLFIGGAYSTANLLSCEFYDGDGESLLDFAFRKSLPEIRCYSKEGVAFWVDVVGYSSAVVYGVVIPMGLAGLMLRQYFAVQEARLFYAHAEGPPHCITLRLEALHGQLLKDAVPKRLLAAVAAYMAVHCHGKRIVRLHEGYVTTTAENENQDLEEVKELSVVKAVADENASRRIDLLRSRRLTEMLTERIMLDEAEDRLLIGSKSLLSKHTVGQDVWIYVAIKLYAVALVCCVSMSDAWKWAIAFSLVMAVLVGACQPYMWPQVSQLQSFSCVCLAVASAAFTYDLPWLARMTLVMPLLLLLRQVPRPDCTEALAERLYQELQSELPKLQQGETHEVRVQQFRF